MNLNQNLSQNPFTKKKLRLRELRKRFKAKENIIDYYLQKGKLLF